MIEQISDFFSIEMIYLWLNIGVLPFWILLIFFSHTRISSFLVTSIFPHLILGGLYIYLVYYFYISGYCRLEYINMTYMDAKKLLHGEIQPRLARVMEKERVTTMLALDFLPPQSLLLVDDPYKLTPLLCINQRTCMFNVFQ